MGLLDFLKTNFNSTSSKQNTQPRSRYEYLPLINPEEDKKSPKGYIERKFITEENMYQSCENIFFQSDIPIVNRYKTLTKHINTLVLSEKNGKKVRSVTEILYYNIPDSLKQDYLQLISQLNNIIITHELPARYIFPLEQIDFQPLASGTTKLPVSRIQYNQEKHDFHFLFANQIKENGSYKESIPIYKSTKYGDIIFSEDGNIKSATYTIPLNGGNAIFKFKNYKSGLDLYSIKYNGESLYKRES